MVRALDAARLNKEDGFSKTITIPNASVLTMSTVGYTLLSAPTNTQYVIYIIELLARITTGTGYTSLHDMTVAYGAPLSQGVTICTVPGTGFLDQATPVGVFASFNGTSSKGTIITDSSGAISILAGTGDPTTGTSPMTVKVKYKIHRIP